MPKKKREKTLYRLYEKIKCCNRCGLSKLAEETGLKIIGKGSLNPDIIFVAEKPPLRKRVHFRASMKHMFFIYNMRFYELVAKAELFKNDDEVLKEIERFRKLDISESWNDRAIFFKKLMEKNNFYITESVRCPTKDNRPLRKREINNCRDFLLEEIKILNPEIICPLGNTALEALTGDTKLEKGKLHSFNDMQVFPTWFPGHYGGRGEGKVTNQTRIEHFKKLKKHI